MNAIQRTILGMTVVDILSSTAWFVSSWAVPRGTFALSAGNVATCNVQGFLLQLAIGAPLYNCSLSLYYLLVLKYRWTDPQMAGIEKWVHAIILSFSLGSAILLLPLEQYNPTGAVCWVMGNPPNCDENHDEACQRGEHAWIYGLSLFYGPLWICVIACTASMGMIYLEVQTTFRRLQRYSVGGTSTHSLGRSSQNTSVQVAHQAILYSASFLITWMPSTLWSIARWFEFQSFYLDLAAGVCEPLQGLWNVWIFARRRTSTKRKVRLFLHRLCPCWVSFNEEDFLDERSRRSLALSRRGAAVAGQQQLQRQHLTESNKSASQTATAPPMEDEDSDNDPAVTSVNAYSVGPTSSDAYEERILRDDGSGSSGPEPSEPVRVTDDDPPTNGTLLSVQASWRDREDINCRA